MQRYLNRGLYVKREMKAIPHYKLWVFGKDKGNTEHLQKMKKQNIKYLPWPVSLIVFALFLPVSE